MNPVEVVGLGAMGWPMAQRLAGHGFAVRGRDANAAIQAQWDSAFGVPQEPAQAVLFCVSDEAAVRLAFASVMARAPRGSLLIDHTTTSAQWAREADALARSAGLRWCDAPLSGGVQSAQHGELVAMLGAHDADVTDARALLAPVAREVVHLGPPGSGQLCKMANQLAIAGVAAGLAQAQAFCRAAGLDTTQVLRVLLQGSARSVQLERLQSQLADPAQEAKRTFAWLRKDLALCAAESAAPLPLAALWHDLWKDME